MSAFCKGSESVRVFQVPFPLGTVDLFISWKAGLYTFVFDVFLQANKYEITQNLGMKEKNPIQSGKAD